MVYRELRETCSKLGEECSRNRQKLAVKVLIIFLATRILLSFHCRILFFPQLWKEKNTAVERLAFRIEKDNSQ